MKNKIYLALLIVLSLVFCTACKSRDDSGDTEDSVSDYYQVHSLDSDLTFDGLVEYLTDKLGVEYYDPFETGSYKVIEGYARLISDYSLFVEKEIQDEIKYDDPGIVDTYEYHITRKYSEGGNSFCQIIIYEFDSSIIAHMYYSEDINGWFRAADKHSNRYIINDDAFNGALLVYDKDFFCAHYQIGRMLVTFSINVSAGGADPYIEFLEIADDLDLPVSDEISETILNAE